MNAEDSRRKTYTEEEHHAALELAATVGVRAAAKHLGIERKTIYRWAEKYPKLWSDLRAGDPEAHKRRFAVRLEDLADRYGAAENDLLERIEDGQLKPRTAKDAAALLKALGSSRQAAVAGARTISGEPEHAELTINVPALEQAMERLLGGVPQPALVVTNEAGDDD